MFGKGKNKAASGITLIANNCEVSGDIRFSDQLLVNGVVKGNIYAEEGSKATVTISEKGRVKGDIRVPNVVVNGKIFGDIHSGKHVELAARAEVTGNVYYNLIEMVMGSRVEGNLIHTREPGATPSRKSPAESESPKPAAPPQKNRGAGRQETEQATGTQVTPVKSRRA